MQMPAPLPQPASSAAHQLPPRGFEHISPAPLPLSEQPIFADAAQVLPHPTHLTSEAPSVAPHLNPDLTAQLTPHLNPPSLDLAPATAPLPAPAPAASAAVPSAGNAIVGIPPPEQLSPLSKGFGAKAPRSRPGSASGSGSGSASGTALTHQILVSASAMTCCLSPACTID